MIEPDGVADDLRWESVTVVNWLHRVIVPNDPALT